MFDESTKLCDVKYKIVFLGSSAVGKSAIIERFIQERFDANKNETVGIDFFVKNVAYKGATYKLQLWDTAGQQKFKSLVPNYIRDAHCAVFVYDICRAQSFLGIDSWIELFKNYKNDEAVMILVGNKLDLAIGRQVAQQQGMSKAQQYQMSFCQTSAKISQGVQDMFYSIIDNIKVGKKQVGVQQQEGKQQQISDCRLHKTKLVRIKSESKTNPCCYI